MPSEKNDVKKDQEIDDRSDEEQEIKETEADKDIKEEEEEIEEKNDVKEREELQREIEEKDQKIENLIDKIQRLQADFENYKKRQRKGRSEQINKEKAKLISDFLPIYDNLTRAFKNFDNNNDKESFIEGIEKIYAQFDDLLSKKEIRPIEAEGDKFDPKIHDALMKVESENHEHNEVVEEFERGYFLGDEILKPSKVKVNIAPTKSSKEKREKNGAGDKS